MAIDYLTVGNITQDLTPAGALFGGTAVYSAITAHRLGLRVGLVTRVPPRLIEPLRALVEGIALHILPTEEASTFENLYRGDARVQVLHHAAPPIEVHEIPPEWRSAPIVHLAAIARETGPQLAAAFAASAGRLCVTPQGWLRTWGEDGVVRYRPLEDVAGALAPVDVLVFSAEDVDDRPGDMAALIGAVPLAAVTRAARGAVVHLDHGRTRHEVPARSTRPVDPTGAGDVFAAAFFVRLHAGDSPLEAATFANAVASISIEALGVGGIPTLERMTRWMRADGA